ncbi:DUF1919 domain-containing protein [Peribacillus glennii]|uniref:DUF1919 domain-containing protein n=1 Tax=Peribacillus glennii TaxID=2303991 RepID=A0A372LFK7_9BACI|nr:DUF1919 domain-containing protein [Peribacillus glennii]RFU64752.1 DUF1919 domain-containing protein [Peribacillus glennii]
MHKLKNYIKSFRSFGRKVRLDKDIKLLKDEKVTVISQNCNGGIFLHDHKMKFLTPTINLYFSVPDFIKFCKNIEHYIHTPMERVDSKEYSYPLGKIDDIIIHFVHYHSFDEAKEKWIERCKRIDSDNLYLMMTDRDGCSYEDLTEFDKLQCKNKVVFVNKPYKEIKSACYVKGFETESYIGEIYSWKGIFGKRVWDDCDFNFANFIKS